jgi:DNA-directed RNA polymerase specialized sigma24 family protein
MGARAEMMRKTAVPSGREVTQFEAAGARPQPPRWPTVERREVASRTSLEDRIRGEFFEMRGVALTASEAARLMGVPPAACSRILHRLIEEGSLRLTQDGRYMRPESAP